MIPVFFETKDFLRKLLYPVAAVFGDASLRRGITTDDRLGAASALELFFSSGFIFNA
jgi:hypothetical protein